MNRDIPNTYEAGYESGPRFVRRRGPSPGLLAFGVFVVFFLVLIAASMGGWL